MNWKQSFQVDQIATSRQLPANLLKLVSMEESVLVSRYLVGQLVEMLLKREVNSFLLVC